MGVSGGFLRGCAASSSPLRGARKPRIALRSASSSRRAIAAGRRRAGGPPRCCRRRWRVPRAGWSGCCYARVRRGGPADRLDPKRSRRSSVNALTSAGPCRAPWQKHRRLLQDRVRPPQLEHLSTKPLDSSRSSVLSPSRLPASTSACRTRLRSASSQRTRPDRAPRARSDGLTRTPAGPGDPSTHLGTSSEQP